MDRKLKVGMVGVAGFGSTRRRRMRHTELFDLVATYDYNTEAMAAAQAEDGAAMTESYKALLETPGLDAMIISSGAPFHAAHTVAALERGIHVFVEKPLACNIEEVEEIIETQRRTGLVVGCGHCDHRSEGFSRTVNRMIEKDELGDIVTFEATTAHTGGFHIGPNAWRGGREQNPGGMLFQCGVHKFHELIYYFGPVKRIRAIMRYDLHETETADMALCQVEFGSGLIGTLNAYHITPCIQSLIITGTRAAIFKDERPWDGESGQWIQQVPAELDGSVEARVPLKVEGQTEPCGNLRSFYEAVVEGGTPYPSAVDGACAVVPVFAAVESAKTDSWVEVESFENR